MNKKIGAFIRQLRDERHMSQQELSHMVNYSVNAVSSWERGETFPNNVETLFLLCEIFDVTIEELLTGERKKKDDTKDKNNIKEKIKKTFICTLILVLITIVVVMYSIYNFFIKGKILSYTIQGNSSHFVIDKSTILFTNKMDILNFNRVISKNDEDIKNIALYYTSKDSENNLVFSGPNDTYYIEEPKGYNEYNLEKLKNSDIYVEITYNDNLKESIPLTISKRFVNDDIISKERINISDNEDNHFKLDNDKIKTVLLNEGFKETDEGFEKINNNLKYVYNTEISKLYLFNLNKNVEERITLDIQNNYLEYLFYDKKKDESISETISLEEKDYKNIKFIIDNIEYLLYLKDRF